MKALIGEVREDGRSLRQYVRARVAAERHTGRGPVRTRAAVPRVLFLSQGRATEAAAMGHIRAEHAVRLGLEEARGTVEAAFATVPPLTLPQRVFSREVPGVPGGGYKSVRWHLARGWAARRSMTASLEAARPDVVHVTTDQVSFLLGGLQRRVPCVLSVDIPTYRWLRLLRGLPEDGDPPPADLRPLVALERRALERAPLTIAWTATAERQVRRLAPQATVAALHPGIDLRTFRPRSKGHEPDPPRVLFVGGRWEAKGGPDLLAALGDDLGRTVELDVVTPAELEPRDGMRVHGANPGSHEVLSLFQRADVVCLPTHVDAVPWAVVEALACGVPVVATRVGSIAEMVGPRSGLLVAPGDIRGLREALHTIVEDPARRSAMGAAARDRAERAFDARRNTASMLERLVAVAASARADAFAAS